MKNSNPRKTSSVRERLLQSADHLFYQHGIHAVGIDWILREANAAKASLYSHFSSKDQLVASYLERRGEQWRNLVEQRLQSCPPSPVARLLMLFDLVADHVGGENFRGCPFINISSELSDPNHPALEVSRKQREWLRHRIHGWVTAAGAKDPDTLTQTITMIYDGAWSSAMIDGNREAARTARWAVESLLDSIGSGGSTIH